MRFFGVRGGGETSPLRIRNDKRLSAEEAAESGLFLIAVLQINRIAAAGGPTCRSGPSGPEAT